MLEIALCDDEAPQRRQLRQLLRRYEEERPSRALRCAEFPSAKALLERVEGGGSYDLFLLDVLLPDLSGIGLGVRLRELGCRGIIVYLSCSPDYAVDSYAAKAFYYLLKPVDPAVLFQVLDRAAEQVEAERSAVAAVKTRTALRHLPLDAILYAELVGRAVRYYLRGGEVVDSVTVRRPFQEAVKPLLEDGRFVLCGSSYAVNLHAVTAVERRCLRLADGSRIPLPRGLHRELEERWMDYWLAPGRV